MAQGLTGLAILSEDLIGEQYLLMEVHCCL